MENLMRKYPWNNLKGLNCLGRSILLQVKQGFVQIKIGT